MSEDSKSPDFPILLDSDLDNLAYMAQFEADRAAADTALRVTLDKVQENYAILIKKSRGWWRSLFIRHGLDQESPLRIIEKNGQFFLIKANPAEPTSDFGEGVLARILEMIVRKRS
jgi:hypothetical protein